VVVVVGEVVVVDGPADPTVTVVLRSPRQEEQPEAVNVTTTIITARNRISIFDTTKA
jgi:hypothetical protein